MRAEIKYIFFFIGLLFVLLGNASNCFAQSKAKFNTIKYKLDSLEKALNEASDLQKINIYNQIAVLFPSIDAEDAVLYAQKALDLAQSQHELAGIALSYQSIGKIYEDHEVWDKAALNYQKAQQVYNNNGNQLGTAYCLDRLGVCLNAQREYAKALENIQKANDIYVKNNDLKGVAITYNTLGSTYQLQGKDLAKAEEYFLKSLGLKKQLKDTSIFSSTLENLATIYLSKQDYTKALAFGLESFQIAQKFRQIVQITKISKTLATIYESLKEDAKANYFLKKQIAYEDSLIDEEKLRHLFEVQAIYEHEKKEIQINNLQNEKKVQRLWLIIFVILLILALLIIYYIYLRNLRKERINKILQNKNEEILKQKQLLEEQKNRIEENGKLLLKLVKSKQIQLGDLDRALMQITESVSNNLAIQRVSIWKYDAELDTIFCLDLFEKTKEKHSRGAAMSAKQFPVYFEAIKSEKIIQADNAFEHIHTKDFSKGYLDINQIYSMLDVPFFVDGRFAGVLCCEMQESFRHWLPDDVLFLKSISQMVTITFKAHKRIEAERQIIKQKQLLEEGNQQLIQKNEEISAQRDLLEEKNNEILTQQEQLHEAYEEQQTLNEELRNLTDHLEVIVEERTNNLQLANQELDLLTYRISHDFRGPITTMLGLVELVHLEDASQEIVTHLVDRVSFTANKMDKMLDKMIMIHTINYKTPAVDEIIDWTFLEEEIHNNLHYIIHPAQAHIDWEMEDELLFRLDVEFLTIIFQNLIENAIRFNYEQPPRVWISAEIIAEKMHIYVKDNGIGVAPKYQDLIFDMFFRGSELSTGNGLGLYIVEKAVQKLGGTIALLPQQEGTTGATFHLIFNL